MNTIRNAFAGALAGLLLLFTATASADAAPATGTASGKRSVCETGYRGMPEYNAKCLHVGALVDGVALWFREDATRKGRVYSAGERRAVCRTAKGLGGIRNAVSEARLDVAYDRFRNYPEMLTVATITARGDCKRLGVRV